MGSFVKKAIMLGMCSFMIGSFLHADTIDTKSVKIEFIGYKTASMADIKGTFKDIEYNFGKDTKSIAGSLQNASAMIVPTSSEILDIEEATHNMNNVFFPALVGKNKIKVTFIKVIEGDNQGLISAKVNIGKEVSIVPLTYTITNNQLIAQGVMDLNSFSHGQKALKALNAAAAGHGGITWANVTLIFTANIIK